jgi:hypothetical protein
MSARIATSVALACLLSVAAALGQSGYQYRRSAIMNGNQVRTVFGNWGVIGQPADTRPRGSWKDDNNGYLGDVSPLIGAEVRWQDTTFRSVLTSPVSRPTGLPDTDPVSGVPWTMEPVSGYFGPPPNQSIALSNDKKTWPDAWPDKLSDAIDPGWRGSWNGYFGKRINADLESYFVMDDNNDLRFNLASNNPRGIAFKPDPANPQRSGLGLEIKVRAMQWAQFLAADNIFWLYEIRNTGKVDYDRVVFGMLVGTYVGVTASDDGPQEYDDDWSFYETQTNITYTGDYDRNTTRNPRWNQKFKVGMVGYAFLESPGSPFDGIDNDGDADTSLTGQQYPKFTLSSFDSTLIKAGDRLILIQNDFSRVPFVVPNADSVKIYTRGMRDTIWIYPGKTKVVEGNVVTDQLGNAVVNRNAYDGYDNNFNGLIDENQYLHYRQFKRNRNPPYQELINKPREVRYINYRGGQVNNTYGMIDEKRNDLVDNNRNWDPKFDDVGRDGIGPTALNYPGPDVGEGDGLPTSGYDNNGNDTGLPGEPNIDKTDVQESDQIGLSSFYYFAPANQIRLGDDEELWRDLAPGYFDVPLSIQYSPISGDSRPTSGEDGDFLYGSGYFPLLAGSTERFSLALVYGGGKGGSVEDDINDLLKNKKSVQRIYDANYQFPIPPEKPTLRAVAGDKQVTLYWDRVAEESIDPVLKIKDFEGYKIYKSTDPNFSDAFVLTDATGTVKGYRPLVQYDLKNDIKGMFYPPPDIFDAAQGISYNLGTDSGLEHVYVDNEVENGRRYYYAVVAYDRGDQVSGIYPGENTKSVTVLPTGDVVTDINVAAIVPNAPVAGYTKLSPSVLATHVTGPATGTAAYGLLDQTKVTGHRYTVTFYDSQNDSIDNNGNRLLDVADSTEWNRITSLYTVLDNAVLSEQFSSLDTGIVQLSRRDLVPSSVVLKDLQGAVVNSSRYVLNSSSGSIRGSAPGSLPAGATYTITFQYYPVFKSPHLQGNPAFADNNESDIFDGVTVNFANRWAVKETLSTWVGKAAYIYSFFPTDLGLTDPPLRGYRKPSDYELRFSDHIVDTSAAGPFPFDVQIPVNFRVWCNTDSTYVRFLFGENPVPGGENKISPLDELILLEVNPRGTYSPTWDLFFVAKQGDPADTVYNLTTGDKLIIKTTKPYRKGDVFEFSTELPKVDNAVASSSLAKIKVVPNPYVTAAEFELPLAPGITSGRGQRRVDFIHLPAGSTIRIFTSRGDHVITITQDGNIEDGTTSWNLKTKENLDVAYGIYFYVVESPVGNATGKIAIIK